MKVSVVIPVYNLENYVEHSIKSVLAQEFDDELEIVVVDDGSTDNSRNVIKKICESDEKVKLICQKNAGVSVARNTGIEHAKGEYLLFVDGDDVLFSGAIKSLVEEFENNKNAILACGLQRKITSYQDNFEQKEKTVAVSDSNETLQKLLIEEYSVSACAKIFKKALVGDLRFVSGKKINEDKYFLFEYLLKNNGDVIDVNSYVYGYYVRNGSATNSSFSSGTLDMLYFSNRIQQDIAEQRPSLIDLATYNNVIVHLAVLKKIIRSNLQVQEKKLFYSLRKETLVLSKSLSIKRNKHKRELTALKIGRIAYSWCVKIYDGLRSKGERK